MAVQAKEYTQTESRMTHAFETIEAERVAEEARHLLNNIQTQGRAADEKVRALFTANTLFVAALVVGSTSTLAQLSVNGVSLLAMLDLVLRGSLLLSLAISLAASVLGLLPRVEVVDPDRSLFFFGHIASLKQRDFVDTFMGMSFAQRAEQLLTQVHINSQIVQVKFMWIQRSARFLLLAVGLWLCALTVHYLS